MRKTAYVLILLFIMSACTQKEKLQNNMDVMPQGVSVKNSHVEMDNQPINNEQKAQHLANLAARIPNVNSANAIALGNIAIVGIDVDADLNRARVGTIKYSVAESLRHDPQGAGAVVVADPDINARLKEIQNEIDAGKPLRGIMNELSAIVGRIMPDVPPQEEEKNPGKAPEQPKKEMNEQEGRQLEKIQQEQSNHQK